MRINGFCLALWLVGVLLMTFHSSSGLVNRSILVSGVMVDESNTMTATKRSRYVDESNTMTATKRSRYLKENRLGSNFARGYSNGDVRLEDYGPVDPSPSQATIDHGPIEHGSPSHPYIPKPKPSPPAPIPSGP